MDGLENASTLPILIGTVLAGLLLAVAIFCRRRSSGDEPEEEKEEAQPEMSTNGSQPLKKKAGKTKKPTAAGHALLAAEIKGHTSTVSSVAFDPSGDYLVSSSADRTIRVWYSKEFSQKEHKYHRVNVELDYATCVRFSPDSRALVASLDDGRAGRVFKLNRKKDGSIQGHSVALDMPKNHMAEIVSIAIASTGKYILTASKDTHLILWDLKGEVLATVDSKQVTTHWADISPCGRFVATCGFTSDVKVYEVKFSKSGEFEQVNRAMELKGHAAATYHFSFSQDSKRMATISKDGTWKLWDIDVRFELKQDPYLLVTGSYQHAGFSLVALAPDALSVAVASGSNIFLYNSTTGECEEKLPDVHTSDITALSWSPTSLHLASAGGDDKHVRIWHNAVGMRASVALLKQKLAKTASSTVRERIEEELGKLRATLKDLSQ